MAGGRRAGAKLALPLEAKPVAAVAIVPVPTPPLPVAAVDARRARRRPSARRASVGSRPQAGRAEGGRGRGGEAEGGGGPQPEERGAGEGLPATLRGGAGDEGRGDRGRSRSSQQPEGDEVTRARSHRYAPARLAPTLARRRLAGLARTEGRRRRQRPGRAGDVERDRKRGLEGPGAGHRALVAGRLRRPRVPHVVRARDRTTASCSASTATDGKVLWQKTVLTAPPRRCTRTTRRPAPPPPPTARTSGSRSSTATRSRSRATTSPASSSG